MLCTLECLPAMDLIWVLFRSYPERGGRGKALEAEKKLAEELRALGHAVHYN